MGITVLFANKSGCSQFENYGL